MIRLVLFNILLLGSGTYALARGQAAERATALTIWIGVAATIAARSPIAARYERVEQGILIVDVATFVALVAIAMRSRKGWTLWVAGFQGSTLLAHIARLLAPTAITSASYKTLLSIWAYLMLVVLAAATWSLRKRRSAVAKS